MKFEAPYVSFDEDRLIISDGRHRIVAMKELGYNDIVIEVPSIQLKKFLELTN
jgi:hypothetical protein